MTKTAVPSAIGTTSLAAASRGATGERTVGGAVDGQPPSPQQVVALRASEGGRRQGWRRGEVRRSKPRRYGRAKVGGRRARDGKVGGTAMSAAAQVGIC